MHLLSDRTSTGYRSSPEHRSRTACASSFFTKAASAGKAHQNRNQRGIYCRLYQLRYREQRASLPEDPRDSAGHHG